MWKGGLRNAYKCLEREDPECAAWARDSQVVRAEEIPGDIRLEILKPGDVTRQIILKSADECKVLIDDEHADKVDNSSGLA